MPIRIDSQAHFVPEPYRAAAEAYATEDPVFARIVGPQIALPPDAPVRRVDEERVGDLDATGCDVQVLSCFPPGAAFGSRELATATASATNDAMLAAAAAYPGRFVVLGTLPVPHVAESLTELARIGGSELLRGILLPAPWAPWRLDDAALEPVFARMAELGLVLVVHPAMSEWPAPLDVWGLTASLGLPIGHTVAAARLVLSGMLDRVPGLDVIVTHLGSALPFLFDRLDSTGRGEAEHEFAWYFRERIWLESFSTHVPALRCAIETVGADRVVVGSDYPGQARLRDAIARVEGLGLAPAERDAVLGLTAARWFGPR